MKVNPKRRASTRAFFICLASAFVALFGVGCASLSLCGNSVLQSAKSPDGKYQAIVFTRDCGATTSFSTHVSVLPAGTSLPDDGGNIFISSGYSNEMSGVRVRWLNASRLEIIGDQSAQFFKKEKRFDAITIVYAPK